MRRLLLAALGAAVIAPAPAGAATLTPAGGVLPYPAAPGAVTDLKLAGGPDSLVVTRNPVGGDSYTDTDSITDLGCAAATAELFTCSGVVRVVIDTGDGNDQVLA